MGGYSVKIQARFSTVALTVVLLLAITTAFPQDADGDGILDVADNCLTDRNPMQLDMDADGTGDVCDCAPSLPLENVALGAAVDLRFDSASDLSWNAPLATGGGSILFDLVQSTDPADFGAGACVVSNSVATVGNDLTQPSAGNSLFYIVRTQAACGGGNNGADSSEVRRFAVDCPATGPLATCVETMDGTCPTSQPQCGANFSGGSGCVIAGLGQCYNTGLRAYGVLELSPVNISFSRDVTQISIFFANDTSSTASMRFFDADNLEVDTPIISNGDCTPGPMPPLQLRTFSRPVRRAFVTAVGGRAWLDTMTIN